MCCAVWSALEVGDQWQGDVAPGVAAPARTKRNASWLAWWTGEKWARAECNSLVYAEADEGLSSFSSYKRCKHAKGGLGVGAETSNTAL